MTSLQISFILSSVVRSNTCSPRVFTSAAHVTNITDAEAMSSVVCHLYLSCIQLREISLVPQYIIGSCTAYLTSSKIFKSYFQSSILKLMYVFFKSHYNVAKDTN